MNPFRLFAVALTMTVPLNPGLAGRTLPHAIMPAPAHFQPGEGRLRVDGGFSVFFQDHDDGRLRAGLSRALRRWEARTGLTFARTDAAGPAAATLVIRCGGPGAAIPRFDEDESYRLEVTPEQATLRAPTGVGVLRGLETLLQMLDGDGEAFFLPAAVIDDAPRFAWRGLMVDVCRHWQPGEVIKRTLEGMALAKLNVLHLHLTDDQGFRMESRRFPLLHQLGSDGSYFTQDEMRALIAFAAERGIRVVPEFDLPGHATSWLVGHPELGSQPGPYAIERRWGIFDPALDPTNEAAYEMLAGFFGEMAELFPDPYLHIGGDENNGKHWSANPRIQSFMTQHGLRDSAALQAHFNRRVLGILATLGKRMVGWDEILHPDLPRETVIHSWQGPEGLASAARAGFATILSNGYYIDLSHPAWVHYLNDPLPAGNGLTPEEQARVLGGEATMWSEWVTPETIDSRIWPRTAAIAERLWSPREVCEVEDMYQRLDRVSLRLEELGLSLTRHVDPMLRRFAGDRAGPGTLGHLRTIADLVEPVKGYRRGQEQPDATQFTPLTGLVDCARPDSAEARKFARLVARAVFAPGGSELAEAAARLAGWRAAAESLLGPSPSQSPRLRQLAPLLRRIAAACAVGEAAVTRLQDAAPSDAAWRAGRLAQLALAAEPHDACELPLLPALRLLVAAASAQTEKASMPPEAWRAHLEGLARPDSVPATPPAH